MRESLSCLSTDNGGVTFLSWYRQWGSHFLVLVQAMGESLSCPGTGNGGVTFLVQAMRESFLVLVHAMGESLSWYRQWGSHFLVLVQTMGESLSWYRQWGSHFLGTGNGGVIFLVQAMGESLSLYRQWGSHFHGTYNGVRVAQSLVFCVVLCGSLFGFFSYIPLDHCIVCPSSI